VKVTATDLDWKSARAAAERIVRFCSDVSYVAPEDGPAYQRYVQLVCAELSEIVKALRITPGGKS
jgi:hypothetical protein